MKLRLMAASAALGIATSVGGIGVAAISASPAPAVAQPAPAGVTTQIPCTIQNVASTCTLTLTSLSVVNGVLQAAGTITGGGVTIPFSGVPVATPAACPVLSLTLGPLHLDLLGLVVDLNQVVLNITAQPGPGQLLGNLLCAVTHLLDGNAAGPALTELLNLVNGILAGL